MERYPIGIHIHMKNGECTRLFFAVLFFVFKKNVLNDFREIEEGGEREKH